MHGNKNELRCYEKCNAINEYVVLNNSNVRKIVCKTKIIIGCLLMFSGIYDVFSFLLKFMVFPRINEEMYALNLQT